MSRCVSVSGGILFSFQEARRKADEGQEAGGDRPGGGQGGDRTLAGGRPMAGVAGRTHTFQYAAVQAEAFICDCGIQLLTHSSITYTN